MHVVTVKKARKDQDNCQNCGKEIKRGDSYKWAKSRFGPKLVKCTDCNFRPSELTSSRMGTIYDAQEDINEQIAVWESDESSDLSSILEEFASTVREVAEEYTESAENMPESLQESPVAEECREKADELEGWADELESVDFEDFEFDEEASREDNQDAAEAAADDLKKTQTIAERDKFIEEFLVDAIEGERQDAFEQWAEEQRNAATEAVDNCPG